MNWHIEPITKNKKAYLNLLLLADESEAMIDRYLERGEMFVATAGGETVAACVVTDEGNALCELKNLAVRPDRRRQGCGSRLVQWLCAHYREKFREMQVGTGDSPLTVPFYEKCGFTYSHRIPDFFLRHYPHPILEAGRQLTDMVYLKKKLSASRT